MHCPLTRYESSQLRFNADGALMWVAGASMPLCGSGLLFYETSSRLPQCTLTSQYTLTRMRYMLPAGFCGRLLFSHRRIHNSPYAGVPWGACFSCLREASCSQNVSGAAPATAITREAVEGE
jgi:hypothetical protein